MGEAASSLKNCLIMKKTFLSICFGLLSLATLRATHIIGGSIFYKPVSGDIYEVKLVVYRDCYNGNPAAFFDDPASIGVFDKDWNLIKEIQIPFNPVFNDTLSFQNTPLCLPLPSNYCVHRAIYTATVTLPPIPGGYKLVYQRCCRSQLIVNLTNPLDSGISIYCTVPESSNTSPMLKNGLPPYGFANKPLVYDAGATDFDGDSLVYRFVVPQNGADPVMPMPQPPDATTVFDIPFSQGFSLQNLIASPPNNYPLEINANTGEIKGLPNYLGVFVVAFAIDEYRNGQFLSTNYHEIAIQILDGQAGLMVAGEVSAENAGPLDEGEVRLIQRNPFTDSLLVEKTTALSPAPAYQFTDVYTSKYLVRGLPGPNSAYFTTHFPAYHPNAYFWYNAEEVEVCFFDAADVNIELQADSLQFAPGTAHIFGKLTNSAGDPVPNFELWLMESASKMPVQWLVTDASGSFKFQNLPTGDYLVYANQPNTQIFNTLPPELALTSESMSVNLQVEPTKLAFTPVTGTQTPISIHTLRVFPNPAANNLHIEWPADQVLFGKITDAAARTAMVFNKNINLDISSLPQGIYQVEIQTQNGPNVARFVKL